MASVQKMHTVVGNTSNLVQQSIVRYGRVLRMPHRTVVLVGYDKKEATSTNRSSGGTAQPSTSRRNFKLRTVPRRSRLQAIPNPLALTTSYFSCVS